MAGILWLAAAGLAVWRGPHASIIMLVVGGFFIFPATELPIRTFGERTPVSPANALRSLGMQVAFVLPLSMPLLLPVSLYRLNWFYPAMMILLGAHYLPFVFLYGMRMFAVLAALLIGGGTLIAMYFSASFSIGAWYTGTILLVFAALGRRTRTVNIAPTLVRHSYWPGESVTRSDRPRTSHRYERFRRATNITICTGNQIQNSSPTPTIAFANQPYRMRPAHETVVCSASRIHPPARPHRQFDR